MNVAALQKHLRDLADCLSSAQATSAVVVDLKAISDALGAFGELKLSDFAQFLKTAEEYNRTGVVPVTAKPKTAQPASDPRIAQLKSELAGLYESAKTAPVERTTAFFAALRGSDLAITALKEIASGAKVEGKVKNLRAKEKIIKEMVDAVTARRAATASAPR